MELESPDYGTAEEMAAASAAAASAAAAAAVATAHDSGENNGETTATSTNPVARAIPYPDPQVRQHVADSIAAQVRAYLSQLSFPQGSSGNESRGSSTNATVSQVTLRQRLASYFMARLHYYEDLSERHCKTEEELQRAELQRMARQRNATSTMATAPTAAPTTTAAASSATSYDVYNVRGKALGDAMAVALAAEAVTAAAEKAPPAPLPHHTCTNSASGGPTTGSRSAMDSPLEAVSREEGVLTAPSVVVLLVPQRDVQRH